jgi:hypothetical protein
MNVSAGMLSKLSRVPFPSKVPKGDLKSVIFDGPKGDQKSVISVLGSKSGPISESEDEATQAGKLLSEQVPPLAVDGFPS